MPKHQLYTMKYVKELEEKTQIHNEKTDEFEEALTPGMTTLKHPFSLKTMNRLMSSSSELSS